MSANSQVQIELSKVVRTLDLSSHLPQITSVVTVENRGSSTAHSFLYAISANLYSKLTFIAANVSLFKLPYPTIVHRPYSISLL